MFENQRLKFETGSRFGRWTVIAEAPHIVQRNGKTKERLLTAYLCVCQCGNEVVVRARSLKSGQSTQCQPCALKISSVKARQFVRDNGGLFAFGGRIGFATLEKTKQIRRRENVQSRAKKATS